VAGPPFLYERDPRGVTTRWLVRFGYDGTEFAGWARQPGLRTVEGTIRAGLVRAAIAPDAASARLEVASRTDRGVHARGNALAVTSDLRAEALLRALNGVSAEIWCTAAAPVPETFRVRRAVRRTYRYFEPGAGRNLARWQRAAARFAGSVDTRSFGRGAAPGVGSARTVESVDVTRIDGGLLVEVTAPSFVWGMVRKIVSALRQHDEGKLSLARLDAGIRGTERLSLPLAEPDRLVLWDVEYPIAWTHRWTGPNRRQDARRRAAGDALWARARMLEALAGDDGPPPVDRVRPDAIA